MAKKAAKKPAKKDDPVYNYDWVTPEILDALESAGIKDPVEQRNWIRGFLAETGGKPRPEMYNGDPEVYFEKKYGKNTTAGKNVGNIKNGDGYKFRGRSWVQLTGRWNYEHMQKLTGYKVADNPDLMNDPKIGTAVSFAYMIDRAKQKGIKDFKSFANVHTVLRPDETLQQREARVLPISDVDWAVIQEARKNKTPAQTPAQAPAPAPTQAPAQQPPQKTPYGVRTTLDQFRKEQSGGITPDTTPPAR